jgi:hypothetical protein
MSRLFYHTMQDNLGNLLFGVSGTMRLAGSGTLATIYGDEALTVILPNPMTNHPSFGSFKCFLGAGDYDFYMAKSGYTFETLTGVQGHGTMAQQDADAVAIVGGNVLGLTQATSLRFTSPDLGGAFQTSFEGQKTVGTNRWNLYMNGTAANYLNGPLSLAAATPEVNCQLSVRFRHGDTSGIIARPSDSDAGSFQPLVFLNLGGSVVGSIATTGAATAYNTASDARLKHDVETLTGELALIQALRPVAFKWLADDTPGVGFLASEVQAVIPDGVITGAPNAVDEEGQIVPQMIDYSKLVPFLVGAIQTLAARLAVLEDALGV